MVEQGRWARRWKEGERSLKTGGSGRTNLVWGWVEWRGVACENQKLCDRRGAWWSAWVQSDEDEKLHKKERFRVRP